MAVLNFSDIAVYCDWTTQYSRVEETILQYQGGGTVIPLQPLKRLARSAERHVLVLLITDFGINNFKPAIRAFLELAEQGHMVTGFFIGAEPGVFEQDDRFEELRERGISFYPVMKVKELIGLVIEEIKRFY